MKWRIIVVWGVAVLVLGWTNWVVVGKARLRSTGEIVFLELAPVDPRSLIQGDYMTLAYTIARAAGRVPASSGALVISRDDRGVAQLVRLHEAGGTLGSNELLLRFRTRNGQVHFGAESFLFQEGHADAYAQAKYAELRVGPKGESILVGLRDVDLEQINPEG